MRPSWLVILTGPSGVGKSTMSALIRRRFSEWNATRTVSSTTRPPRPGEQEGANYYYLTAEEFCRKIRAGEFLEFALYNGNLYGTSRRMLERQFERSFVIVADLNVDGCRQMLAYPDRDYHVLVFPLFPDDMSVLEKRIRERPNATDEEVAGRLKEMPREVEIIEGGEFGTPVISRDGEIEVAADEIERRIKEAMGV